MTVFLDCILFVFHLFSSVFLGIPSIMLCFDWLYLSLECLLGVRLCVEWRVVIVFAFDGMVIDCSISRFLFLVFHLFSNVLIDGVSLEWLLGVRFVVSVERCDCIGSPCIYNRLRFCWIGFQRISSVFMCFDWLIVSLSQYCCSLAVFLDLLFIFRVFPPLSYVLIDYMSLLRVGLVCVMVWGVEDLWSCLLSWDWRSLAVSLDWFLSYFISYLVFWLIESLCWVFFIDFSRISSLILCFDWLRLFLECLPGVRRCGLLKSCACVCFDGLMFAISVSRLLSPVFPPLSILWLIVSLSWCGLWRVVIVFAFDGLMFASIVSRLSSLLFHLFSYVLVDFVSLQCLLDVRWCVEWRVVIVQWIDARVLCFSIDFQRI